MDLSVLPQIIGTSSQMITLRDNVTRAGGAHVPILILGESGTGKELVAHAVHQIGNRADEPFVAINCAAISPGLIESELFGHEKGAFTGAQAQHKGIFEQARYGTVFLDEVAELPAEAQAKLLRVIDSRTYRRVGGSEDLQTGARIFSATNRDLGTMVSDGMFRLDLFYRLAGYVIQLPPLREHKEDIPDLVQNFFEKAVEETGQPIPELSKDVIHRLNSHEWPGNVRELEMVINRILLQAQAGWIDPEEILFEPILSQETVGATVDRSLSDMEKNHIIEVLNSCKGNKSRAANVLGIARKTLYAKLRAYGIEG